MRRLTLQLDEFRQDHVEPRCNLQTICLSLYHVVCLCIRFFYAPIQNSKTTSTKPQIRLKVQNVEVGVKVK